MTVAYRPANLQSRTSACPQELRDAWARVFAYAWSQDNKDFLHRLNKDPRQTITAVARNRQFGNSAVAAACSTILRYVEDPNSEEGFLALPPLPDSFTDELTEEQLYTYARQDGLYGILRIS
ncbi:hypothetical protein [Kamptonema formosum]|uniref:hypothetical protein n=1 Tax=Kamptonema formosum TaxID=331992 RepID=UPI00034DE344|nr:hypothetical protein [Oscillatoria sp. PCC 10802]